MSKMVAERGRELAAAGGNILEQWPTIAPDLAGKVAVAHYDDETRTLHLRPGTPAYRTQLTLHQRQIITGSMRRLARIRCGMRLLRTRGPLGTGRWVAAARRAYGVAAHQQAALPELLRTPQDADPDRPEPGGEPRSPTSSCATSGTSSRRRPTGPARR
ncbi:DciA family protein [Streptomyces sp. NPDC097727]|uniref:DciA family protein n=1 Tax=Streptomyces sp. NPDC097727 TaxID=3366092 RepID=UPI00380BDF33